MVALLVVTHHKFLKVIYHLEWSLTPPEKKIALCSKANASVTAHLTFGEQVPYKSWENKCDCVSAWPLENLWDKLMPLDSETGKGNGHKHKERAEGGHYKKWIQQKRIQETKLLNPKPAIVVSPKALLSQFSPMRCRCPHDKDTEN